MRVPVDTVAVTISPMRRRDLRSVLKIETEVYPKPWTIGLYMGEITANGGRSYIVARANGAIVGYGGVMLLADEGHVTTIAVDPGCHRHKVGTRLLLVLVREALMLGAKALTLEVRVTNRGAQELYRRFGFVPAGIRKNYYREIEEDALVMWAHDVTDEPYGARLAQIEAKLVSPTILDGMDGAR